MFDPAALFANQFEPYGDDYLIYDRAGGKLVTRDEHDQLIANWKRTTGLGALLKQFIAILVVLFALMVLSTFIKDAEVLNEIAPWAITVVVIAPLFWAKFAPQRLVRQRAPIAPRRRHSESRRAARKLISWRMIISIALGSGLIFAALLRFPESRGVNVEWWVWTVGSGLVFVSVFWTGVLKFREN